MRHYQDGILKEVVFKVTTMIVVVGVRDKGCGDPRGAMTGITAAAALRQSSRHWRSLKIMMKVARLTTVGVLFAAVPVVPQVPDATTSTPNIAAAPQGHSSGGWVTV